MKPNASLITFLTISEENYENIFFIFIKEINDCKPEDFFWYPNLGKDGKSDYLWKEKKVKQWVAIGEDSEIDNLWKQFFSKNEIKICFNDKKKSKISFKLPSTLITSEYIEDDIYKIENVNLFDGQKFFYTIENWENSIANKLHSLFEETTLLELEGYTKEDVKNISKIKPIYPTHLFEKGFLFKMFNKIFTKTGKGIICVKENRGINHSFHGLNDGSTEDNTSSFIGFVQAETNERKNLKVAISDLDDQFLNEAEIDDETGIWRLKINKKLGDGKYYLIDKLNNRKIYGQNFYFIKNFSVNVEIMDREYKDLFGRRFLKSNKIKQEINEEYLPEDFYWDKNSYSSNETSLIDLSDKLCRVIKYLGPTLLISDPYLLGEIKNENGIAKMINDSQKVFISSLFTESFKGNIKEIKILGYKKNLKKFIENDNFDNLINNYKMLFKELSKFDVNKVTLKFSKQPFHDRYWLGLDDNKNSVFRITNSISGLSESGELGVNNVTSSVEKVKIINTISTRWKNAEEEIKVYERNI